ncbi:MAG: manganese efflux pump MntP family protein [Elusimicrobiota bacterium]|jgi:putative Mn2+ efflux pump MntP|nr:manganese efflux pump MntP family protein [Elusimicrobiota bacterium]
MGIFSTLLLLLCIATGCFAIGCVSGSKLGSYYKSDIAVKAALVFVVANLIALSLSFVLGRLLLQQMQAVGIWIAFSLAFLIGIRLLLESIEKSPSLNYTDIVQNNYLIRLAVQDSVDSFMLGFMLALVAPKLLLPALFFSAVFNFFAMTLGISHGNAFTKSVIGKRLELAAGIVVVIIAIGILINHHA